MKCDINLNGLKAEGVDIEVYRIELGKKVENVRLELKNGKHNHHSQVVCRMLYFVKISKDDKVIQLPQLMQSSCIYDNKTNPFKFAEKDFISKESVTAK